jgi:uncharacterized membrane protein (DUF2068 family)
MMLGMKTPPGTEELKRFRPQLRYELIGCGLNGHELLGTNAKRIRSKDDLFVREIDGLRWYRCLRCDSWLVLPQPTEPTEEYPPEQAEVTLPLRGKPLRDRYVLRLIAVDRALHVLLLSSLAMIVFLFAAHNQVLHADYTKYLTAFQAVNGGVTHTGELAKLGHLFKLSSRQVYEVGFVVIAYAVLEGAEMVGLWFAKRWAEYLTFIATLLFIPYEMYELIHKPTAFKIAAFVINVGITIYLLYAKRLFGIRGGGRAEHRERQHDTGWEAIERATLTRITNKKAKNHT